MKRSDIQGWLLTTLALGVLSMYWLVLPGCVIQQAKTQSPPLPMPVKNFPISPSTFKPIAQVFSPFPEARTLKWDYYNTTGSFFNDRSNVVFKVFKCLDLGNQQWILFGVTTNTYMNFQTTNRMEFYRVTTLNIVTGEESL